MIGDNDKIKVSFLHPSWFNLLFKKNNLIFYILETI